MSSPAYRALRAYNRWRMLTARLQRRANRWSGVRILGYHRLAEDREPLSVAPEAFRRQMELLLEIGLEPVSLEQALERLDTAVGHRYVCVTFDDGYRDNVEHGEPVLAELGIPATIFLPTAMIDGRADYFWYQKPPPALGWEEVSQAAARGVIGFGSHTVSHPWLPQLADEAVRRELADSRREILARTGQEVITLAYPGGLYGEREQRLAAQTGYVAALGTAPGVNAPGADRMALRRTLVYAPDTLSDYEAKLAGLLDGPARLRAVLYSRLGPSRRGPAPLYQDDPVRR